MKQVEVIYNKVGANATHLEFHPERPLIAVPSLLEGAVAPHRGAPSHQPFESLQCAAEPRQGAFRRSYYYTLFIIYLIRCCVFPTSELRRLSLKCISDKRRMLNGISTQAPEIFRTRRQLSQKRQQCVWSTARTLYLPAGLHAATSLQPPIFVRWMHFKVLLLRE
jgi:hypothetical protein